MGAQPSLILASASPRRRELLAQIGVTPARVEAPEIDETPHKGELPAPYALRMALEKAAAIDRHEGEIVLAGDTTVALGRRILPQAENEAQVASFLALLSGRRHKVHSAVAVIGEDGTVRHRLASSVVRFKHLSREEIGDYAASGEGVGKAGGYAVQGRAAGLIDFVSGSYSGVVGLPLYETRALLKAAGLDLG